METLVKQLKCTREDRTPPSNGILITRYSFSCVVLWSFSHEAWASVMMQVDRADFCPIAPYKDAPQSIGHNATISAPHMHAYALGWAASCFPPAGEEGTESTTGTPRSATPRRILDVGSGSGYLTVAFARLFPQADTVVGIDHIPQLTTSAIANARKHHGELLDTDRLLFVTGDGRMGYPPRAPYDLIHVGAAAGREVPEALLEQLAPGGLLILPVGQRIWLVNKDQKGQVSMRQDIDVLFVPLTDRELQE